MLIKSKHLLLSVQHFPEYKTKRPLAAGVRRAPLRSQATPRTKKWLFLVRGEGQ